MSLPTGYWLLACVVALVVAAFAEGYLIGMRDYKRVVAILRPDPGCASREPDGET